MAILFDNAASEYLEVNAAPVTTSPFSMGCWFYSDETSGSSTIMFLGDKDNDLNYWRIDASLDTVGDPVSMTVRDSGGFTITNTSSGITQNTWHHACLVVTSATDRIIYIDGGNAGTSAVNRAPSGSDRLSLARFGGATPSQYFSGREAEAFICNAALSAGEVALLSAGFSPLLVKPSALVFYLPMIALGSANTQYDWVGGRAMTETNTPATAPHPPNIIYPSWMTNGIPVVSSALSGTLRMTGGMTAIPLAANYKIFSSDVPRRTFVSR